MSYCSKCGKEIGNDDVFCKNCGFKVGANPQDEFQKKFEEFCDTPDSTADMDYQDILNNKISALLCYLGALVLIPIFMAKNSKYARFHANQGLILLISEVVYSVSVSVLCGVLYLFSHIAGTITSIVVGFGWLGFIAFVVIGIINAVNGKARELPIIGKVRILN